MSNIGVSMGNNKIVSKIRFFIAILASSITAVYIAPLFYCLGIITNLVAGDNCVAALGGYSWYGFFVVPFAMLFFAAPLGFLFLRKCWFEWWQIGLCGAVIGLLMAVLLNVFDSGLAWYRFASLATPIGFSAGIIFWVVGVAGNTTKLNEGK